MKEEISLDEIKAIIELVRQTESVTDFTLKIGDVEISLSRDGHNKTSLRTSPGASPQETAAAGTVPPSEAAPIAGESHLAAAAIKPAPGEIMIKSPMVGTFYRCPKPGDPPFVEVGAAVQKDTVLCIIEVMKLMNSLEAKVTGVVTRILVEDAQPVAHGQPLMIIKVDGA
jgi:acetyl-CoA carboxylase biotin carboxyl carrier protein